MPRRAACGSPSGAADSALSIASVAKGQGSSLAPGPRQLPSSFDPAHGQPFARTRRGGPPGRVARPGRRQSRSAPAHTPAAARRTAAHPQVSFPVPPYCGPITPMTWKGPSDDTCAITLRAIQLDPGIVTRQTEVGQEGQFVDGMAGGLMAGQRGDAGHACSSASASRTRGSASMADGCGSPPARNAARPSRPGAPEVPRMEVRPEANRSSSA